jgi:hypothetical protein
MAKDSDGRGDSAPNGEGESRPDGKTVGQVVKSVTGDDHHGHGRRRVGLDVVVVMVVVVPVMVVHPWGAEK